MTPAPDLASGGDPGSCSALGAALISGARDLRDEHAGVSAALLILGSELQRYAVGLRGAQLIERHRASPGGPAVQADAAGVSTLPAGRSLPAAQSPAGETTAPTVGLAPMAARDGARSAGTAARFRGHRADARLVAAARRGRAQAALRQAARAARLGLESSAATAVETTVGGLSGTPRDVVRGTVRGAGRDHPPAAKIAEAPGRLAR